MDAQQIQKLEISEKTARVIACIKQVDDIYTEISDVLTSTFGNELGDEIAEKAFPDFDNLDKSLKKILMYVIEQNLAVCNPSCI